jgi:hypothetical protein
MAAAKKVKMSSETRGNPYGKTGAPGKADTSEVERDANDAVDATRKRPPRDDLQAMGIDMPPPRAPAGPPQMPPQRPMPGQMQRPMMPPGGPMPPGAMQRPPIGMPQQPPPGMPPQQMPGGPMPLQRTPEELATLQRMQGLYGGR